MAVSETIKYKDKQLYSIIQLFDGKFMAASLTVVFCPQDKYAFFALFQVDFFRPIVLPIAVGTFDFSAHSY
jgi:hypothetical protein